jgi:hypothetical protein
VDAEAADDCTADLVEAGIFAGLGRAVAGAPGLSASAARPALGAPSEEGLSAATAVSPARLSTSTGVGPSIDSHPMATAAATVDPYAATGAAEPTADRPAMRASASDGLPAADRPATRGSASEGLSTADRPATRASAETLSALASGGRSASEGLSTGGPRTRALLMNGASF